MAAAGPIAADYRWLRSTMAPSPERTRAMEKVVHRMHQVAAEQPLEPDEVVTWLREGNEEQRISALGAMQIRRELRDLDAVLATLKEPSSNFEQFHTLLVLASMVDDLEPHEDERLVEALTTQRDHRIAPDSSRWRISEDILRRVNRAERRS